ncbi:MAG: radical SAM protein [Spirochaetes bacterium]|nr:radical SAM protein [Spirochaetota bacterium]
MPKRQVTIPVFIPHLGCRHRCIFCNQWGTTDAPEIPSPDSIDALVGQYAPFIKKTVTRVELAFFGGSFTGIPHDLQESYLAAACRHLDAGTIHGIRLSTRPDYITPSALDLLRKYRVSTVELGAQSFDDDVLTASGRGHTASDIAAAAGLIAEYGFGLVIQLMPGLPRDTGETALASARAAADLNPEAVRIYPAVVLAGTAMERLYRENAFAPLSLEDAVEICAKMYRLLLARTIRVIRMGLHPFAPGQAQTIIAGPYHPSFGYLVKSRARRNEMAGIIETHLKTGGISARQSLRIVIPELFKEEYIGRCRDNIRYLERIFNLQKIDYTVGPVPGMQITHTRCA